MQLSQVNSRELTNETKLYLAMLNFWDIFLIYLIYLAVNDIVN